MWKLCDECGAVSSASLTTCLNCGETLPERLYDEMPESPKKSDPVKATDHERRPLFSQGTSPAGNAELVRIADATERTAIATERIFLFMVISAVAAGLVVLIAFVLSK